MTRSVILAVIIAALASGLCSAGNILLTGLPIGAGKYAVQGYYDSHSLAGNSTSQFGPKMIYGVSRDLDVSAKLGMGSYGGVSASSVGVGCRYNFLRSGKENLIDLAGYINYETFSITGVSLGNTSFGIIMSRSLKSDFTLYCTIGVASVGYDYKDEGFKVSYSSSALQFGIGAKYDVKKDISFLGELSTFSADGKAFTTLSLGAQFGLM